MHQSIKIRSYVKKHYCYVCREDDHTHQERWEPEAIDSIRWIRSRDSEAMKEREWIVACEAHNF